MSCQITAETAFLKLQMGEIKEPHSEINACLQQGKAEVKALFSMAIAQVAKRPAVSSLLKDYYAIWLTTFDGISPDANERKFVYEKRQGEALRRVEEAWNRFEIEAGS